jgi:hypothetical protein
VVVGFVDIGGIVDHHWLIFLFIMISFPDYYNNASIQNV